MKILREKRIRKAYVEGKIEKIAGQMVRTITGEESVNRGKRFRNICRVTGRGRGVIRGLARQEWRQRADRGEIQGVRRASW